MHHRAGAYAKLYGPLLVIDLFDFCHSVIWLPWKHDCRAWMITTMTVDCLISEIFKLE